MTQARASLSLRTSESLVEVRLSFRSDTPLRIFDFCLLIFDF